MNSARNSQVDEAVQAFQSLLQALHAGATSEWMDLHLTMPQLKGLFAIQRNGPLTVGLLAETLGIGLPAASQLVERLVQSGVAERNEDLSDRRRALVCLSPEGERLVVRLQQVSRDRLTKLLSVLEEDDLTALIRGLRALAGAISTNRLTAPISH